MEEGYCLHNVLASYVHLHFGACPELAAALVERCRGVDVAAVGAAAHEAAQTACYLESAMGSLHASPQVGRRPAGAWAGWAGARAGRGLAHLPLCLGVQVACASCGSHHLREVACPAGPAPTCPAFALSAALPVKWLCLQASVPLPPLLLQLLGKGVRGVPHCRSSPDLAREGQLNGKQRATAMADPHRHLTEDGLVRGRHSSDATPHRECIRHRCCALACFARHVPLHFFLRARCVWSATVSHLLLPGRSTKLATRP